MLGEPHAPTADFGLVHEAVHQAKHLGKPVRVGPIVSSDIFYQPDPGLAGRWSERGILAVEMEAAVLFTLGALRKIQAGCMLIVSDVIVEGEFLRISDEDMRKAVDEMTELALHTVTRSAERPVSDTVFLVNPAAANGSTGRRWPEIAHQAAGVGPRGRRADQRAARPPGRARPGGRARRRPAARRRRRRRLAERGRERARRARRDRRTWR